MEFFEFRVSRYAKPQNQGILVLFILFLIYIGKTMADQLQENKVSFKDTLNLPRTDFPIRANAKIDDPAMVARWEKEDLFTASFNHNQGKKKYILHDGPPYANGHLHLGHAYNKILKDMVCKVERMMGNHVPVQPGWDCHGLPIEHKVTTQTPGLSREEIKKACRAYAAGWIEVQKEEFKKMGVLMDWNHPYSTMDYSYEAAILRAFGIFVHKGYIERKNKTVPWCPSCQTVLAAAEIEHEERKDPSIYVLFPLTQETSDVALPKLAGKTVNLLIWTTTPWTLPLNRAVTMKPDAEYVVLELQGNYVMVGKQRADMICGLVGAEKKVVAEITSNEFLKHTPKAQHPFIENMVVPILSDPNISLEDGTAFVHCAPGCGPEDYEIGVKNNLEIFSPVGPDGKYTVGIVPQELVGMPVADGQIWVIKKLAELGRMLYKTNLKHAYPHCWRCHGGLIFRATKQWFCDLSKNKLKEKTLEATNAIKTIPEKSINRLQATLEGRLEWCLSRQRVWGAPIPALVCKGCDYTFTSQEFINTVAEQVAQHGIEYWDAVAIEQILPAGLQCPKCNGADFAKEQDILDVWFESGVSHFAVLKPNPELAFPADIYLEGKDQHRAWFQSSLLTGMVLEDQPPMKTIMTHGFTVDEKGRKMSKSLGNVVAPQQLIDKLGTDGLRLWVSSLDCSGDAVVSEVLLQNVQEVFRKVRNTCRFLLSNLYDFDIEKDAISLDSMRMIDQYALQQLYATNNEILSDYQRYDFTAVFHKLAEYCTSDLSAFYLDIIKDRLYVEKADGLERRSAQTACWYILDTLTKLMAPILSFTAEQISDNYQKNKKQSIHLQDFATLPDVWRALAQQAGIGITAADVLQNVERVGLIDTAEKIQVLSYIGEKEQQWILLKSIRGAILKAIEQLREQGTIKHSLEAQVTIFFEQSMAQREQVQDFFISLRASNQSIESFFEEFLIVSQVVLAESPEGLDQSEFAGMRVHVQHAAGDKCPRCWKWERTTHEHKLCKRCQAVVNK